MTFYRLLALLFVYIFTFSCAYAERYGFMMENSLGHIPTNGKKTHPTLFSVYYTGDQNIILFNKNWALHASFGALNSVETELGLKTLLFNYSNKRYFLSYGILAAYSEDELFMKSGENISGAGFLRLDYEEELTLGMYFTAGMRFDTNLIYDNDAWVPRLSIGLKLFSDDKPVKDEVTRMTYVDIEKILEENKKYDTKEVRIDRSKEIQKLKDISRGKVLDLPKFVPKGKPFIVKKVFESGTEISKVTCKIDGIKNTLYKFAEVEPNTWAARIIIPKDFALSQINITLYVRRSDGSGFEEYATTLVE